MAAHDWTSALTTFFQAADPTQLASVESLAAMNPDVLLALLKVSNGESDEYGQLLLERASVGSAGSAAGATEEVAKSDPLPRKRQRSDGMLASLLCSQASPVDSRKYVGAAAEVRPSPPATPLTQGGGLVLGGPIAAATAPEPAATQRGAVTLTALKEMKAVPGAIFVAMPLVWQLAQTEEQQVKSCSEFLAQLTCSRTRVEDAMDRDINIRALLPEPMAAALEYISSCTGFPLKALWISVVTQVCWLIHKDTCVRPSPDDPDFKVTVLLWATITAERGCKKTPTRGRVLEHGLKNLPFELLASSLCEHV